MIRAKLDITALSVNYAIRKTDTRKIKLENVDYVIIINYIYLGGSKFSAWISIIIVVLVTVFLSINLSKNNLERYNVK